MKIQDMFQKDINRDINGVVKVQQDDTLSLVQELEEYVITKELRRHFTTFFDNYSAVIDHPTDKIGVWISGFFGSGKSHFLKILSYLLSNKEVGNRRTVDYFENKFDDPMMFATVTKCTNLPTESILFNIDVEGPINKDKTAVLRVFAKVFYNHLGFYGEDLKIAKLERFVEKQGKTDLFRTKFEEINGSSWLDARDTVEFFQDDVVSVLQDVLGMSETSAYNWFNGSGYGDLSIKQLVDDIKEYVDSKGKNFRLLFCADEVGQYIGDDGDLMINLQTLVEELGSKCQGQVWVMVTSQEAIDSVVKITGDDFSKIQGRFNTRLSLSSASVDEVIKRRILSKTPDAERLLNMVYDKESAVLKNIFTFTESVQDIKGFSSSQDFSSTYPFVPYQFRIMQNVLVQIRQHGNSGKHLSGGERSMLSGFQEAAQKMQNRDENALVPFWLFYDTVHTFLESPIRRVIDRSQEAANNSDGLEQGDVNVLKLLYLIRYIDDVKSTIDNIAILMVDDLRVDKIALKEEIKASLQRLENQNYIARNGDTYSFLTDEEQDVAVEIRNTIVDSNQIVNQIGRSIFSEIYPSKKIKIGRYDFDFDQYIDDQIVGKPIGGVSLRFVTVASDLYQAPEAKYQMDSRANYAAYVQLSSQDDYFKDLESAAKIRKYIKQKNVQNLPSSLQKIIRDRQDQARKLELDAQEQIEASIVNARFYIFGEKVDFLSGNAKSKIDEALKQLIESVYTKLHFVNVFYESDADIQAVLQGAIRKQISFGNGQDNELALNEMSMWLEDRDRMHVPVSMGDVQRRYQAIPYGWREIDIAGLTAELINSQLIELRYAGEVLTRDNRNLTRYLRNKNEVDKVDVKRRIVPSEDLMRKTKIFLLSWLGQVNIPDDEDGLVSLVVTTLENKLAHYNELLGWYQKGKYPDKPLVESGRNLITDILTHKSNNVALLTRLVTKQDELLVSQDNLQSVEAFFRSQVLIFDKARELRKSLQSEKDYLDTEPEIQEMLDRIAVILNMEKPYREIKELPELIQKINASYQILLNRKKEEVNSIIQQSMGDVHTTAGEHREAREVSNRADVRFDQFRQEANVATDLTSLDAMIRRIQLFASDQLQIIYQYLAKPDSQLITPGEQVVDVPKITQLRRIDLATPSRLSSQADVDQYVDEIHQMLTNALQGNDVIQII